MLYRGIITMTCAQHGTDISVAEVTNISGFHRCAELWTNDCRLAGTAGDLAINVVGS